jgi:hypothetical protein
LIADRNLLLYLESDFDEFRKKLSALRLSCPPQHRLWFRVATRILEALRAQIYSTGKDRLLF